MCALDDLDGDDRNEYAFIGVKSMRLRVASGKSGELLREVVLSPAGGEPR